MTITPLQKLLRDKVVPDSVVRQVTGRTRFTLIRWRKGESFPEREDAEKLIALFGAHRLDFNGCYQVSVEVEAEHD